MARALLVLALLLPFAGCTHTKTRLDCIDTCKSHGLRYVEVEHATAGYDPVERKELGRDVCRCE